MANINPTTGNDLDAENLAKAIRQKESGGNYNATGDAGTSSGGYQFQAATWKRYAKDVLGDENAEMTPQNQNAVAYGKIKKWKDDGNNAAQIAAMWNAGEGMKDSWQNHVGDTKINGKVIHYDTPQYVKDVTDLYQQEKSKGMQVLVPPEATQNKDNGITGNEDASTAGFNALKNTVPSAFNFGKGVVQSVNPLNIAETASQIPGVFSDVAKQNGGILGGLIATAKEVPNELYKGLVPQGIRQAISGDLQGASKSFQEDPFGQAAPAVLGALGGAKAIDNLTARSAQNAMADYAKNPYTTEKIPTQTPTNLSGALDTGISKVGGMVTKPVSYLAGKAAGLAKDTALSTASQLTTLPASGIIQALKNPETMSKIEMENASRGGLAGELKNVIDTRIGDLSDMGTGYDAIRNSNQTVSVPQDFVSSVLDKYGLKVKKGQIVADTNSITRNPSDLNAINKFYKDWSNKKTLTPNEFLNMRGDLGELSKFDKLTGAGKTKASETIGQALYEKANSTMRDTQLQELKALDDSYAPETKFLKQVKKEYFNPDGTLKDGAGNKIANAGNKVELLKRLENLMPGISKRIQLLKIIEDVQHSNEGFKVGAYTRGGLVGGAILTLNIPAIVASIISSPGNALQILRGAGYVGAKAAPVVSYLKKIVGDTTNKSLKTGFIGQGILQSTNKEIQNQSKK